MSTQAGIAGQNSTSDTRVPGHSSESAAGSQGPPGNAPGSGGGRGADNAGERDDGSYGRVGKSNP